MAYKVGNRAVIDNNRNLSDIAAFDSLVQSVWDSITTSSVSKTLVNREYCVATGNNITITLPNSSPPSPGNQCVVSVTTATGVVVSPGASYRIQGLPLAETLALDIPNASIKFTYIDATRGWIIS